MFNHKPRQKLLVSPARGGAIAESLRTSNFGDIDTGHCYRQTCEALAKNPGVDMAFHVYGQDSH